MFNKIASVHIIAYLLVLINISNINNRKQHYVKITFLLLFTLLLGIFWSSLEVLWGGLWNWNLVEMAILLIFILSLLMTHQNSIKYFNVINLLLIISIFFLFNRITTSLNIHNFTNNKYLNNTNIFFSLVVQLLIWFKNYFNFILISEI